MPKVVTTMPPLHLLIAMSLATWLLLTGCHPTQPFYLNEDGDLSHLIDSSTDIEYPDVEPVNDFVHPDVMDPVMLTNFDERPFWDLTLQEAIHISLHNTKVFRSLGPTQQGVVAGQSIAATPSSLTTSADVVSTIFDPAIQQTSNTGEEQALAAFDAQFATSAFWEKTDRPQNFTPAGNQFFVRQLERDLWNFEAEISKRSAQGTQWFVRNTTQYDQNNQTLRAQASEWLTTFEAEARHPFLRNGGTAINRIPVVLARIRTDISLADFEGSAVAHVAQVERAYWDLFYYYQTLRATKVARDSALLTLQRVQALASEGYMGSEADREAQARVQYWQFQSQLQRQLRDLLQAERSLRWMMGIDDTDPRMLRPADSPTRAPVVFEWADILTEATLRRPEIRRQKWRIKEAEMQLMAAKNQLLPQLDGVVLYRFLGLGDELWDSDRLGLNFPQDDSTAFDELTEGKYQEYRFGFQFNMPIGFRRELAQVRNSQLTVRRARERLDEMEREVRVQLSRAVVNLDGEYVAAESAIQQVLAARDSVKATEVQYHNLGTVPLDLLLQAQQSLAEAEIALVQAWVQYNLALLEVHRTKGSLLEHDSVLLAEGPWPKKAYFDALDRARQRDASYYLNYGYSRPRVFSRGPVPQHPLETGASSSHMPMMGIDDLIDVEPEPTGTTAEPIGPGNFEWGDLELPATPEPLPAPPTEAAPSSDLGRPATRSERPRVATATHSAGRNGTDDVEGVASARDEFAWGDLGL